MTQPSSDDMQPRGGGVMYSGMLPLPQLPTPLDASGAPQGNAYATLTPGLNPGQGFAFCVPPESYNDPTYTTGGGDDQTLNSDETCPMAFKGRLNG